MAERILESSSWDEWMVGVAPPPPAPGPPAYATAKEIDVQTKSSSIDTYLKSTFPAGGGTIIHLRIQKWYQPDLDLCLFRSSRKLERKFGRKPMDTGLKR